MVMWITIFIIILNNNNIKKYICMVGAYSMLVSLLTPPGPSILAAPLVGLNTPFPASATCILIGWLTSVLASKSPPTERPLENGRP